MTNRLPHQALTPGPTEPGRNRGWNVAVVPGAWSDFFTEKLHLQVDSRDSHSPLTSHPPFFPHGLWSQKGDFISLRCAGASSSILLV